MPIDSRTARAFLDQMLASHSAETLAERLAPKWHDAAPRPTAGMQFTAQAIERRWALFPGLDAARAALLDQQAAADAGLYARNVEYFMGTVKVPVGVAGPLRVNGLHAQGDYLVPLATTEAALVASYSRGMQLLTECGGADHGAADQCRLRRDARRGARVAGDIRVATPGLEARRDESGEEGERHVGTRASQADQAGAPPAPAPALPARRALVQQQGAVPRGVPGAQGAKRRVADERDVRHRSPAGADAAPPHAERRGVR